MRNGWVAIAAVTLTLSMSVAAQNTPLAFDAVSVHQAAPGTRAVQRILPTRIDFVSTPLRTVLFGAFRITDVAEASVPAWTMDVRVDIQATYPTGATPAQVPEMLQTLLKDKFELVTHIEPRRIDGYELIVASDGLKIPEVQAVNDLEKDFSRTGPPISNDSISEGFNGTVRSMVLPTEIGGRTVTERSLYELRTLPNGVQRIDAIRITMREFASLLRLNLNRPVFDHTGLMGVFQFKTELDRLSSNLTTTDRNGNPFEPTGLSTFKAVEALGLKVQQLREPVPVLVVDKMNRTPTAD